MKEKNCLLAWKSLLISDIFFFNEIRYKIFSFQGSRLFIVIIIFNNYFPMSFSTEKTNRKISQVFTLPLHNNELNKMKTFKFTIKFYDI